MKRLVFTILSLTISASLCLVNPGQLQAKADLSLNVSDISFSKDNPIAGEKIRIFARVFNLGDQDVYGFVIFSINGKEVNSPQPISVKVGTYDDVFIDWIFEKGDYDLGVKIASTYPADENYENDAVAQEDYFIDSDSDGDGVGDASDDDKDNDGLNEKEELVLGTDVLNYDTDGDSISDKEDKFPLDQNEWQDIDRDGLGDNLDEDADNDGLSNEKELVLGTNHLKGDTDGDFIPDKTEAKIGFLNPNHNEWASASRELASLAGAIKLAVQEGNASVGYLFAILGFLSIILFISRFLHQKRNLVE